jgi:DNA repair exonuclease SbcCD ATPase subunit
VTQALVRLHSVEFENAGTYRLNTGPLPLAKLGTVLVNGAVGSGKSLISEVPTMVLFSKGSPRNKTKTFTESSISNGGYLGKLTFDSGFGAMSRRIAIEQSFKHPRAGSRYAITIDGVRDETTGKPAQKQLVKRLAPLTYDEWLGVVYLAQCGSHALLAGSATEQRQYLTAVFGLSFYDDLVSETKEAIKSLTAKAQGAVALEQQLADLKGRLRDVQLEVEGLPSEADMLSFYERMTSKFTKLNKELGSLEKAEQTTQQLATLEAELAEIPTDKGLVLESIKRGRTALTEQMGGLQANIKSADALAKSHRKCSDFVHSVTAVLDEAKVRQADASKVGRALPGVPKLQASLDLLKKAQALGVVNLTTPSATGPWEEDARSAVSLRSSISRLEKLLAHDHQKCPTCDADLEAIEDTLNTLKVQLTYAETSASQKVTSQLTVKKPALWKTVAAALKEIQGWLEQVTELNEANAAVESSQHALDRAAQALADLPPLVDVEGVKAELVSLKDRVKDLDVTIANLQNRAELEQQIASLQPLLVPDVEAKIADLTSRLAKASVKRDEAVEIKSRFEVTHSEFASLKKQKKLIDGRLAAQMGALLELQTHENTLLPYFETLRASKVRGCVGVLEGVLPVYVEAAYKGAVCTLKVSDDLTDVEVGLKTGVNDGWITSTQASVGQRQLFTLAMLCALREISPRAANVMWFDEPFTGMEASDKLRVVTRLFPTLRSRCPDLESLFIVAHDAEILQSANDTFDQVWTVTRDAAGSKVTRNQTLAGISGR